MPSSEGPAPTSQRGPVPKVSIKHPLEQLSVDEVNIARQVVIDARKAFGILFRNIYAVEPAKAELIKFLKAEHNGTLSPDTPRPPRQARVQYDTVSDDRSHELLESIVDIASGKEVELRRAAKTAQTALIKDEFIEFTTVCLASDKFKQAIKEFNLDEKYEIAIDPWPCGGPNPDDVEPRYTQGLIFAKLKHDNPDTNHYAFPLPIIPVMDTYKKEITRIDRLATGGTEDGLEYGTGPEDILGHCVPAEYVPELLDTPMRTDVKPLNVFQPDGPSFTVSDDSLIEWQKWRFRVG